MKYSNLRAFEKHLQDASPAHFVNFYVVLAKDTFERKTSVDLLITALLKGKKEQGLALKIFDGDHVELGEIQEELQALMIFADKRVVLINQADKLSKSVIEFLVSYFENPNPAVYLILSAAAINHATNFYKKSEKTGVVLEIPEEKPWEKEKSMGEWIVNKVRSEGKRIEPQACQAILKQIGTDPAFVASEVEKLICYTGERVDITLADVGAVCTNVNTENAWQLGEAIFRCDAPSALRITKALLADGTPFLALLRQIRTQFQTEFQVCSILAGGGAGSDIERQFPYMKGNILNRHIQLAQGYGLPRFKKGLLKIDQTELMAKNSSTDHEFLADLLIVKLTS